MIQDPWRKILHYTHIWVGLLTTAFFILYLLTGVFLNHTGFFKHMETRENREIVFNPQERAVAQEFMAATKQLNAAMAKYTRKPNYDNIYINSQGVANFLDRSGKKYNFHVQPSGETGVISQGYEKQPWYFMNNQLHRTGGQRGTAWKGMSTAICVLIFIVLLSGLLILPWKRLDVILLLAGVALLLIGMVVAEMPHANAAITIPWGPTLVLCC